MGGNRQEGAGEKKKDGGVQQCWGCLANGEVVVYSLLGVAACTAFASGVTYWHSSNRESGLEAEMA